MPGNRRQREPLVTLQTKTNHDLKNLSSALLLVAAASVAQAAPPATVPVGNPGNSADATGYWPYAIKGGSAPECNLGTNNPTDGGKFDKAARPYGTFDQNGNAWEYNETIVGDKVGLRGGSWFINDNDSYLQTGTRYEVHGAKWPHYGFRVVALGGESK